MSTAKTATQNQKSKFPHHHTSHHKSTTSLQPPTESMIEAAKVDYATRLFLYTQQQLQQVYSSPSDFQEKKNNASNYGNVGNYGEVRNQKVKKAPKRNW